MSKIAFLTQKTCVKFCVQILLLELAVIFFPECFDPLLVQSTDVELVHMEE